MKIHDVERLKAYPMVDLASHYGIKLRRFAGRATGCCCLPGHRDRNPSFSITESLNLGTCWGCAWRGDNFDLVGAMEGISGFHQKACRLEEITGIPQLQDARTPFEKDLERRANALAAEFAQDIADWAHGVKLFAERRKQDLVAALEWSLESQYVAFTAYLEASLADIPRAALLPASADPCLLAAAYRAAMIASPKGAERIRQLGQHDREDAERITDRIVQLLAKAADMTEVIA